VQVVGQVEIGILDPQGVVQPPGHLDEPTAKGRQQVEPLAQHLSDPGEGVATGDGARVEDRDLERVHVERRGLHVQEPGVDAGQPLHGSP
jgi:hypothetical protein